MLVLFRAMTFALFSLMIFRPSAPYCGFNYHVFVVRSSKWPAYLDHSPDCLVSWSQVPTRNAIWMALSRLRPRLSKTPLASIAFILAQSTQLSQKLLTYLSTVSMPRSRAWTPSYQCLPHSVLNTLQWSQSDVCQVLLSSLTSSLLPKKS